VILLSYFRAKWLLNSITFLRKLHNHHMFILHICYILLICNTIYQLQTSAETTKLQLILSQRTQSKPRLWKAVLLRHCYFQSPTHLCFDYFQLFLKTHQPTALRMKGKTNILIFEKCPKRPLKGGFNHAFSPESDTPTFVSAAVDIKGWPKAVSGSG